MLTLSYKIVILNVILCLIIFSDVLQITLVIPGENTIPQYVRDSFSDVFSYRLSQLPVYRLLEIPFITAFVKKGNG